MDRVALDKKQSRHMEKVLRLKPGEHFIAFDGTGWEYTVRLTGAQNGCLIGEIEGRELTAEPAIQLTLVQGIAKGDKMDTIIQKAVEVGVFCLIPVVTRYTVVRLQPEKAIQKVARWRAIAREACKQCGRSMILQIKPIVAFSQVFTQLDGTIIMLYENEHHTRLRTVLKEQCKNENYRKINLLVGPEGGFDEDEVEAAVSYGAQVAGLGRYILRTETAGLVAASIILYTCGEIG